MEWKKALARMLKELGLIDEGFIGRLIININQGGVTDVEKTERLK